MADENNFFTELSSEVGDSTPPPAPSPSPPSSAAPAAPSSETPAQAAPVVQTPQPVQQPAPSADPQAAEVPIVQAVVPPSQPAQAAQQPPAQVQQQAPQSPSPTPQPAAPRAPTTEEILARRNAWITQLETQYKVPDDQVDILSTEPHKVLPKMAANIIVNTYEALTQYVNHIMPQMVGALLQQHQTQRKDSDRFFEAWPQLNKNEQKYIDTIGAAAHTYRKLNPTASVEDAIENVGRLAATMLGLPAQRGGGQQPAQVPATPPPNTPKPFSHAAPGVAHNPAPEQRGTPAQGNFYSDLVNGLDLSEL